MQNFSLLRLVARPHGASSGQIHDNRAVFRNGEQPFGSPSSEWSVLGVLTDCGLPRVCPVLWTSPEEPPAPAGAQLEARRGLAPLILRQASCWQLPSRACVLLPRHASPLQQREGGCPELGPQDLLGVTVKCHPVRRCRSPRSRGTPVLCHGLSAPCNSLHGGCGLAGSERQRAGFHVKRAIKGRNLLTWRSV